MHSPRAASRRGFTLIELLVVIAIIAILAVVVVLTLNPAQLLAQSRDANRVSDMATLQSALNLYTTDQSGNLQLGNVSSTYISVPDLNASTTCGSLGLPSLSTSTGQYWACSSSSNYRLATSTGWVGTVNFNLISAGAPLGSVPVDPVNQTSTGLFYAYNTNGSQFQVTADLESSKYKTTYGANPNTTMFPEVVSGGTPGISALYNPTGLVGYWPMDEGVGSTTADMSGNGNTGTWQGTSAGNNGTYYVGGKVGTYAGDFNGTSDRVIVSNFSGELANQPAVTISGWVLPPNAPSTTNDYFGISGATDNFFVAQGNGVNTLTMRYGNASTTSQVNPTPTITPNVWNFISFVWNGSYVFGYINGNLIASSTATSQPFTATNTALGIGWVAASSYLAGQVDDVRVYTRALSPAEIAALYNAEK